MIIKGKKLGYKDVLIVPRISKIDSRKKVKLERNFYFPTLNNKKLEMIPIAAANMASIGTFSMAAELSKYKILTCVNKHEDSLSWKKAWAEIPEAFPYIAFTMGMSDNDISLLHMIEKDGVKIDIICLDVANGYQTAFAAFVAKVRKEFPTKIIIAGNVVTPAGASALVVAGANIVKIGIGPGSVCTTRFKTGVGYPQISAISECASSPYTGLPPFYIMADGGCTCPGDIAKAFVAGADMVMLGGMLAGHDENPGDVIDNPTLNGEYKEFYGSASATAKNNETNGYRAHEGKHVLVPYKGPVKETIEDIFGGLRSAGTYINAHEIEAFGYSAALIEVDEQTNDIYGKPY